MQAAAARHRNDDHPLNQDKPRHRSLYGQGQVKRVGTLTLPNQSMNDGDVDHILDHALFPIGRQHLTRKRLEALAHTVVFKRVDIFPPVRRDLVDSTDPEGAHLTADQLRFQQVGGQVHHGVVRSHLQGKRENQTTQ